MKEYELQYNEKQEEENKRILRIKLNAGAQKEKGKQRKNRPINRYEAGVGKPYTNLLELVKDKDYFVLTTNVDHQFQLAGFDKKRLFYTQGDYGLWQCSKPCHDRTYDNEEAVRQMVAEQKDMKIPSELIPHCPICGAPMNVNLRCDDTFVEDEGWHKAAEQYNEFIRRHENMHILFLELGVGANTPVLYSLHTRSRSTNNDIKQWISGHL